MKRIAILICPVLALMLFFASCHNTEHAKEEEAVFKVTQPIKKDTVIYANPFQPAHRTARIGKRLLTKYIRRRRPVYKARPTDV